MRKYHRYILVALGVLGASSQTNGQSVHTNSLNALSDLAKFQFNPASTPEGKRGIFGMFAVGAKPIFDGSRKDYLQSSWRIGLIHERPEFSESRIHLGAGWRSRIGFWSVWAGVHGWTNVFADESLLDFARMPINDLAGRSLNSRGIKTDEATYYHLSLGWASDRRWSIPKLRVGGRINLLQGVRYLERRSGRLNLQASPDGSAMQVDLANDFVRAGDMTYPILTADSTAFSQFYKDNMNARGSYGVSVDFGFEYDLAERWQLSGGLSQLGVLRWSKALRGSMDSGRSAANDRLAHRSKGSWGQRKEVRYAGDLFDQIDAISAQGLQVEQIYDDYYTWLPAYAHLALRYDWMKQLRLNALAGLLYSGGHYVGEMALGCTWSPNKYLDTHASLVQRNLYDTRVDVGLNVNIAQLQWTLTTAIPLQFSRRNDIFIGMGFAICY